MRYFGIFDGYFRQHPELLAGASMLVGLHPDQPTGAIVAVANARVPPAPFAVVPCCVFTELFPERVLGGGGAVRETHELAVWLAEQVRTPLGCAKPSHAS